MMNNQIFIYGDLLSQPVRTIALFCKLNNINITYVPIDLFKEEHLQEEYKKIR